LGAPREQSKKRSKSLEHLILS